MLPLRAARPTILIAFLAALALSTAVQAIRRVPAAPPPVPGPGLLVLPAMTGQGPTRGEQAVGFLEWGPPADPRPPVLLLHGSPGSADNFTRLGPAIAREGRRVIAIDLPGFGRSGPDAPDYSIRAHARAVLSFMDELGIDRAHILGWSMGGGVALNLSDLDPRRLASLTLLGSIGVQETEGSGSYHFEHAKYALGYALLVGGPRLLPHFGLIDADAARPFLRNFLDSDQRPLRAVMQSLDTPVLILHGRYDFLVADWAAERHHELIPTSRLVMTPYSHFMPFLQPAETAGFLEPFLARHDAPGVPPETGVLDLAPRPVRTGFAGAFDRTLTHARAAPWWAMAALFALLARLRRETATALAGVLVAHVALDFGVAFLGLLVGRALHPREPWLKRDALWVLGLPLWTGLALLIAQIAADPRSPVDDLALPGFVAFVALLAVLLNLVKLLPTRMGRRRIAAVITRTIHHEWWPSWALYGLVLPRFVRLACRHRSLTCWTCVNPGIHPGGGVVGESKQDILRGFNHPGVLAQRRIEAHASDRVARALELVETDPALGGFPVIVKPDAGQRGANVALVRTPEDLGRAVRAIPGPVDLQRFHPGPAEFGVFWVRDARTVGDESTDRRQGRVLAVTKKIFPAVEGDGRRTLGRLILEHPRFNLQAPVYCAHLRRRLGEIPAAGERVTLTTAGNHARGCRFEDGAHLVTPELTEAVDRIARTWRGPAGEPFDSGRFDVRCASEDDFRTGAGLAVIELNGVTSEATNLYDPSWTLRRSLAMLGDQWAVVFELGAARMALGVRPLGALGLLKVVLLGPGAARPQNRARPA
jgi:pimeloyl-ACP methyl ester carboxylesterase